MSELCALSSIRERERESKRGGGLRMMRMATILESSESTSYEEGSSEEEELEEALSAEELRDHTTTSTRFLA